MAEGGSSDGREERLQPLMALPDRPEGGSAEFPRRLAELVAVAGVEVEETAAAKGGWELAARAELRTLLQGRTQLPEELYDALVWAGIYDPNPSFNRQFIEPAVVAFGRRRVLASLIDVLQHGTNVERAGAARARYWCGVSVRYLNYERRIVAPESQAALDEIADLRARWQDLALQEFVSNADLDVRRCILPGLSLREDRHAPAQRDLVRQAIEICRTHPDEYIRHRVEVQV